MDMKIGWITIANDDYGSTRIGITNIHNRLAKEGIYSSVISWNKKYSIDIDLEAKDVIKDIEQKSLTCVVFHKVFGPKTLEVVDYCKKEGIKVVYCNGDWHDNIMFQKADSVIVGSPYIKEHLEGQYPNQQVFYIDDALELTTQDIKVHYDNTIINMLWYGNFSKLDYARKFINSLSLPSNYKLTTCSNAPCSYTKMSADITMGAETGIPWDTKKLSKHILDHIDIVVVPIDISDGDPKSTFAKTANRITLPMSLGVPVVATPIPTYQLVIEDGFNGFLCHGHDKWKEALLRLQDPKLRNRISGASLDEIRDKFSIDNIINYWIPILQVWTPDTWNED